MKILIIRNIPHYMAVRNNSYNVQEVGLAKAMIRKGHQCDIVFWTDKEEETIVLPVEDDGEIRVFYKKGKSLLKNAVYVNCVELFEQYEILQPCEYNQIEAWHLSRKYPKKTIIYHGPYFSKFNTRYNLMSKLFDAVFLKSYIKRDTKFIVKSWLAKDYLIGKGIQEKNICVAGVGIDTQMLSCCDGECREELHIRMTRDADKLKILYIGCFDPRRNLHFILDIFNTVYRENTQARLYLIGTGDDKYMDSVWSHVRALGINGAIFWQERMEQKYLSGIYKLADFFLLPTEYEIFGMVLLEAMYYKTVVLTTLNGGSSTLIINGENGFIIESQDKKEWADKILKVSRNKDMMEVIQENAHKCISDQYTWDNLADRFLKQYLSYIENGG